VSRTRLRAGSATDVGRARHINQDCFLLLPEAGLYVVADGMGGHQGGEVAARLAVETIQLSYQDASADALVEAIDVANHRIRNEGDADPDLRGMGTTVVALVLLPDEQDPDEGPVPDPPEHLLVANVGDSRAYLFRGGDLLQLTEDHSMVADLVREGRITPEEAEHHPQRNIVTRVLGVYESVAVDLWPVDPVQGDRILLCSDGLFNEVSRDQITAVLRRLGDPDDAAKELVRLANESGGRDNITVVVVDVEDDGGVAQSASAALAGQPSGLAAAAVGSAIDDPAGFTAGLPAAEDIEAVFQADDHPPKPSRAEKRAQRKARRRQRTRFTWRFGLFLVALAIVLVGAVATIQWYGTSTYYVTIEAGEVVIYQGRPDGVLWIEPELVSHTGIAEADVPAAYQQDLTAGREQASLEDANAYVANIQGQIDEAQAPATTTTTTSTTSTTVTGGTVTVAP
jgi:protein phosphatase